MKPTEPKDTKLQGLLALYDLHTDYFNRAIEGVSDTDAHDRKGTKANHVAWLAGSLVHQRYELLSTFTGEEHTHAGHDLFKDNQGIKEDVTYPTLDEYKKDWAAISPLTREALANATMEKLNSNFEMMPDMKFPFYDLVTFSIYREANMIGQVALWRRLLGYGALNYM